MERSMRKVLLKDCNRVKDLIEFLGLNAKVD